MKSLRRVHLYLGCFFAPLLLFYVATGWYQTFHTNRNKTPGELGGWKERLTSVHVDQIYPTEAAESFSPALFRAFVVAMAIALITTVALGILLAFRTSRRQWPVWLCLGLGIVVPVLLLWLGQKR
ncbi:MAG: DUF543 domain-containing protein [Verrucomicrobia bacterium]|nr:DUF543 domain-containing protein [Verrucomicrobiota bacterium]